MTTINSITTNPATINSATINSATINSATINSATLNTVYDILLSDEQLRESVCDYIETLEDQCIVPDGSCYEFCEGIPSTINGYLEEAISNAPRTETTATLLDMLNQY